MSCSYGCLGLLLHFIHAIRAYLLIFSLLLYCQNSISADFLDDVVVYEKEGIYHISISSEIDASDVFVRQVLTDYAHIYRLSDSIIESRVLTPPGADKVQVETLVLSCIPMFCKEVSRVEEVNVLESGNLHMKILPEKSDFYSGQARWEIKAMGDTTQLTYQATLEPDFFIPPILGTQIVIENLRKEFSTTFLRVQHIASINETREWNDNFEFMRAAQRSAESPCITTYNTDPQ